MDGFACSGQLFVSHESLKHNPLLSTQRCDSKLCDHFRFPDKVKHLQEELDSERNRSRESPRPNNAPERLTAKSKGNASLPEHKIQLETQICHVHAIVSHYLVIIMKYLSICLCFLKKRCNMRQKCVHCSYCAKLSMLLNSTNL